MNLQKLRVLSWLHRLTLVVEALLFWSALSFFARPNSMAQLLFMLSILILPALWLAVLVALFRAQNKQSRVASAGVLCLAPLCLFFALYLSIPLRNYLFYRDLPRMQEVVNLIQNGSIPITDHPLQVPPQYDSLAYSVHSYREFGGSLTVIFFVGGGFPVKHHCYLYRSNGLITPRIRQEWMVNLQREQQWFEISD